VEDSDPETAIVLPKDPVLKTEDTLEEVSQFSPLSPDVETKQSPMFHEVRDSSTESDKTVLSVTPAQEQSVQDSSVPTTPGTLYQTFSLKYMELMRSTF
jgi:hypothetical protein